MGKFRKDIPALSKDDADEVQVGMGLLNEASKAMVIEEARETLYIPMDRLKANPQNRYSIEDIEKLADSIKMAGGILQDIIVKPKDGKGMFEITTGERRWRAAQLLKERGEYPAELQNKVPCKVMAPEDFDLPLDDEKKEMFSILVTNQYREKTDGDRLMEYQMWKTIFEDLRKNGVEVLGFGENEGVQIKGRKTRELIAEQMHISTGQASRIEKVEKQGSENTIGALISGRLDLSTAEDIVDLDKEEQDEILKTLEGQEKVEKKDVNEIKRKREPQIWVNKDDFQKELSEIQNIVMDDGFHFSESDYKKYQKCLKTLRELLKVLNA